MNGQAVMTPPDCWFCHFNNYLLKNHWLISDMTGFDVSQLWAHYVICELELLSFPVGRDRLCGSFFCLIQLSPRAKKMGVLLTIFIFITGKAIDILKGGMDICKYC